MDKKIVGVIGAIAGLAALDQAAQATPAATSNPDLMNARSFAELLNPIPNALAALRAADAATAHETQEQTGNVQVAGYHHHARWRSRWVHHHHHHNRWQSRRHHHHHHHHHLSY